MVASANIAGQMLKQRIGRNPIVTGIWLVITFEIASAFIRFAEPNIRSPLFFVPGLLAGIIGTYFSGGTEHLREFFPNAYSASNQRSGHSVIGFMFWSGVFLISLVLFALVALLKTTGPSHITNVLSVLVGMQIGLFLAEQRNLRRESKAFN